MAETQSEDVFGHIEPAPLDPILGTAVLFNKDPSPLKINLGIGVYRTNEGKPYVLKAVREADRLIANDMKIDKEYLPQGGHKPFCRAAIELVFGPDHPVLAEDRVAVVQSLSGTGALRLAGQFLSKFFGPITLLYSEPTWSNHLGIFETAGLQIKPYRYWSQEARALDINGMLQDIESAPPKSAILLHACAHNPTGVDPTPEQWQLILEAVKKGKHIAFFDLAYQGFASGDLDRDAYPIRMFAREKIGVLVCQSFAKNFGLYNERVGTMSVVGSSTAQATAIHSQMERIIRTIYSSPPAHGALLVHTILSTPHLKEEWLVEMKSMADRIKDMRAKLHEKLVAKGTPGNWDHIINQIGMFSYTGLSVAQSEAMVSKHHVYMPTNGRISMAGVNESNVERLAEAIDDVVRSLP